MKFFIILIICVLSFFNSHAQVSKIYIDSKGNFTGISKNAVTYVLIKKNSDSDYYVQKYNLHDTLLLKGDFKDSMLTVPNGKFSYYTKNKTPEALKGISHIDTITFLSEVGYFSNGLKTGMWTEFEKRGIKRCTYIYKGDKLNGLYQRFERYHNSYVTEEGNYVDGLKEGVWNLYGYDTIKTPVMTRTFNKDKKIAEIIHLTAAKVPYNMSSYFVKKMKRLDTLQGEIETEIIIGVYGEIKSPKLISSFSPQIDAIIMDALVNMPHFTPQIRDGKPEEINYSLTIIRVNVYKRSESDYLFMLSKKVGNGMGFAFRKPIFNDN